MIRTTVRSLIVVVVTTLFFGGVYPLVVTGIAKVAFSHEANVSLIKRNGARVPFELAKIASAIQRAGAATGEFDEGEAQRLAQHVGRVLAPRGAQRSTT